MTGGQSPERRRLLDRQRQRHKRERDAQGRFVPNIDLDEVNLVDLLVGSRFLDPNKADDRGAINSALKAMIESMTLADVHMTNGG